MTSLPQTLGIVDANRQGVDIIAMFNTFKGQRTIELSEKWMRDIPILAKDFLRHGRVQESTFDQLGYPIDTDMKGNTYSLPEEAIATQTHRQRMLHLNHKEMIPLLSRASTEIIAAEETSAAAIAQEENWRITQLQGSIEMERLLHQINAEKNRNEGELLDGPSINDFPDLLYEPDWLSVYTFPIDSSEMTKGGLPIQQFVRARRMSSSNDKSFKPPPRIGKMNQLKQLIERLKSNPNSPVTSKEDSWLWRMYQCINDPLILPMLVQTSCSESPPSPNEPSILQRTHIVTPSDTQKKSMDSFAIIDNEGLLKEACNRIINSAVDVTNTGSIRMRVVALYPKLLKRFNNYKNHNIPSTAEMQHHYAIAAYERNITRCLELVGICDQIMANVETASFQDSLLPPKGVTFYCGHDDEDCEDMQGVGLYHDVQRARFVHAVCIDGKDKSFKKQYEKDRSNSRDPSTELSRAYPFKKPHNSERGGWNGMFDDLDLIAAFVINSDDVGDDDCLTRDGGLFLWGDELRSKLDSAKVGGADTLRSKQKRLALCMIEFTYVLMMSQNDRITHTPFMPFMGRSLNLQKNRDMRDDGD